MNGNTKKGLVAVIAIALIATVTGAYIAYKNGNGKTPKK